MFAHETPQALPQVRCLEYSLANGADVTLNSYGGLYADSAALKTAIGVAEAKGQLFVTAAGNDYGAPPPPPSSQCRTGGEQEL